MIEYKIVKSIGDTWYVLTAENVTMCICDSETKAIAIALALKEFLKTCVV
jgi:hypothetical protein